MPASASVHDFAEGEIDRTGDWPLVPDADYLAVYVRHVGMEMRAFKSCKLFIHFRIVDPGEHHGKVLYRAYRVKAIKQRTGRPGDAQPGCGFVLARRSELLMMLCKLSGMQSRPDRVSLRILKGIVLKIRTRTVKIDYKQRPLPPFMQYSVVADVLQTEAGQSCDL